MLEENKIKDIFKKTSLENEDWLEPSLMVFQNIEAAINSKKRRRWFWLIPLLGIFISLGYLQLNNSKFLNNASKNKLTSTPITTKQVAEQSVTTNLIEKNGSNNDEDLANKKTSNKASVGATKSEEISKTSILQIEDKIAEQVKSKLKSASSNNIVTEKGKPKFNKNKASLNSSTSNKKNILKENAIEPVLDDVAEIVNKSEIEKHSSIINNKAFVEATESVVLPKQVTKNSKQTIETNEGLLFNKSIEKLQLILPNLANNENVFNIISPIDNVLPTLINQAKTNWSLGVTSGFSYWDYSLNNNLKSALKPADFSYTNSKGYFVALTTTKTLSKKFSFVGSFSFEKVYNTSGHNSEIEYKTVNENNQAVSFYDIKMASTLGFVDARLEIQRQNDVSVNASSIIVDLNNEHQISSVDFSAFLAAKIININSANVSMRLGLGLAQIISVKNKLTSFSTSLPALRAYKAEITANQNELNKTRPFIAFGGDFVQQLNATNKLFITYTFKSDFNTLYQSGELSSFLNKHNLGLGCLKRF